MPDEEDDAYDALSPTISVRNFPYYRTLDQILIDDIRGLDEAVKPYLRDFLAKNLPATAFPIRSLLGSADDGVRDTDSRGDPAAVLPLAEPEEQ